MPVLLRSQVDTAPIMVRRQGRFAIEKEAANSPRHFFAAVMDQQERMISGMAMQGLTYVENPPWDVRGPFNHLEFSDDATVDPGPQARPDLRDLEGLKRWDAAERTRIGKRQDAEKNLVDFVLVGTFMSPGAIQHGSLATGRIWTP